MQSFEEMNAKWPNRDEYAILTNFTTFQLPFRFSTKSLICNSLVGCCLSITTRDTCTEEFWGLY